MRRNCDDPSACRRSVARPPRPCTRSCPPRSRRHRPPTSKPHRPRTACCNRHSARRRSAAGRTSDAPTRRRTGSLRPRRRARNRRSGRPSPRRIAPHSPRSSRGRPGCRCTSRRRPTAPRRTSARPRPLRDQPRRRRLRPSPGHRHRRPRVVQVRTRRPTPRPRRRRRSTRSCAASPVPGSGRRAVTPRVDWGKIPRTHAKMAGVRPPAESHSSRRSPESPLNRVSRASRETVFAPSRDVASARVRSMRGANAAW